MLQAASGSGAGNLQRKSPRDEQSAGTRQLEDKTAI